MVKKAFKDISLSRLGMGAMRLPLTNPKDPKSSIDYPAAHEIFDRALAGGINYFDTAYVYNAGDSEKCLGEWIKKQDRDSFYIASKFHIGANPDYKGVFEEQLERLQTDHIDFYLIHCLMNGNIDTYLESGCIEYFLEQKQKGRIRYLGFSSHADVEVLERFANHHQWDFAQLQINYYDWLYSRTKEEYKILADRNIPIMVMEPVRGGRLAELSSNATDLLKNAHPDWSIASWALRFVEMLPAVQTILSGMSDMAQMEDNLKTFESDSALSLEDRDLLFEACKLFKSQVQVPCTACRYCVSECPMEIHIPDFLKVFNAYKVDGKWALSQMDKVESSGKPKDCISCGACMKHCPQNIEIPAYMKELAEALED